MWCFLFLLIIWIQTFKTTITILLTSLHRWRHSQVPIAIIRVKYQLLNALISRFATYVRLSIFYYMHSLHVYPSLSLSHGIWGTPSWEVNIVLLVREKGLFYAQWQIIQSKGSYMNFFGYYLKGAQCFVSEDHTISQQNTCCKAYKENWKIRLWMCLKTKG